MFKAGLCRIPSATAQTITDKIYKLNIIQNRTITVIKLQIGLIAKAYNAVNEDTPSSESDSEPEFFRTPGKTPKTRIPWGFVRVRV